MSDLQKCALCSKSADNVKLLHCARCKIQAYCSAECQKSDWPSHKSNCRGPNYVLKVSLCPGEIVDPEVTRTLSCPANATFAELHDVLQIAFGWAGTHAFDFKIRDANAEPEPVQDVEYVMAKLYAANGQGLAPPEGLRQNLIRLVQDEIGGMGGAFGGRGVDFMHNGLRVHSATPEMPASRMKLSKAFENAEWRGATIQYEYDFGDMWKHEIEVIGRVPATNTFECTAGGGHGVAEDAGGPSGWQELKEAYKVANPSKEQREKMRWFERQASNNDSRGLGNGRDRLWDQTGVNFNLSRM